MSEDAKSWLTLGAFLIFIVGGLLWITSWRVNSLDAKCNNLFGSEWTGRTALYSQDVCVNKNGEVKYP